MYKPQKARLSRGASLSSLPNIRIGDLSDCYLRLVEAACLDDSPMTWVEEIHYTIENGAHNWG